MTHISPLARRFKVVKERKEKNTKRILSIVITIFIITNLFGAVMTASAVENEFSQKQYNNITNTETYDINTGSEADSYIDINEGVPL